MQDKVPYLDLTKGIPVRIKNTVIVIFKSTSFDFVLVEFNSSVIGFSSNGNVNKLVENSINDPVILENVHLRVDIQFTSDTGVAICPAIPIAIYPSEAKSPATKMEIDSDGC